MGTIKKGGPICMWQRFSYGYPFESHRSSYNNHIIDRHSHDFPQLFYCLSGEFIHIVDDVEYSCKPGTLIIIPPGKHHIYKTVGNNTATHVQTNIAFNFFENPFDKKALTAITFLFLHEFSHELKINTKIKYDFIEEKEYVDEIFKKLSRLEWRKHVSTVTYARSLFLNLFTTQQFQLSDKTLSTVSSFLKSKFIPILKTVYYININFAQKITIEHMTTLSNICRTDYLRYFKRLFGITFQRYLSSIRVSHAIFLCKFSRYSFDYIATTCGFSDHSHMDVQFKKYYTGELPNAFRHRRNRNISMHPSMIMSRTEYENLPSFFYSYIDK